MTSPKKPAQTPANGTDNDLLLLLKKRFEKYPQRHPAIQWETVEKKLLAQPDKIRSLEEMENSGGEPDVVGLDEKTGEFLFYDCSEESPKGRRSCCYDQAAQDGRKEHPPKFNAMAMARQMGAEVLTEKEYRYLQELGSFDTKTSSWLQTPDPIRKLGGAVFGDRRYNTVFLYHNGADSYYAARGFRCVLRV